MPSITGPITGLINDISASVTGLVDDILGRSPKNDPARPNRPDSKDVQAFMSNIDAGNWLKLTFPYTFSVIDISGGTGANVPFGDFELPLAPSAINQTEEFAVSIKPTQGGTTVTHSGNRYKTLNIEGTTGVAPFRGTGGVNAQNGEAIFQPKKLKFLSGYEVFLLLRNWFRAYYEYKKTQGSEAKNLRLVFKNYKDGEFLIVELLNFEMDRQAARPFLYDYKMEFKVIAHLNFTELNNVTSDFENALANANQLIDQARGVFLRTQGILRQIESTYESVILEPLRGISLAVKAFTGIGTTAADVGNRIISNTVDAASTLAIALGIQGFQAADRRTGGGDPALVGIDLPTDLEAAVENEGSALLATFEDGLLSIPSSDFPEETQNASASEQEEAAALPKSFYQETVAELDRVRKNAEDFFNVGSEEYDQLFDRTATLSAEFTKSPTQEELDLLKAFNDASTGIKLLLFGEELFKSTYDARIQDMVDRFGGNIELFANSAVKQIVLKEGDELERLAQQQLGDSTRWGEIVEVNNLKPPYIVQDPNDTRSNVLKPGDKMLIPIPSLNGFSQVPQAKEIKTTKDLDELSKSLGTDFKLTPEFDLGITASGDLELVSGPQNMAQAVLLKLSYEPGEVIRYPQIGAGILPGGKFPDINDIKDGLTNTLLQDNRIETVTDISLRQENSKLTVNFNIFIKQVDQPIPITIKVG